MFMTIQTTKDNISNPSYATDNGVKEKVVNVVFCCYYC